mmetsp:Transcript_25551/g.35254  ORF Transcript_25551/g.35254 Transcript_25551/m.35254 type:complete len:494 (+) Transcript_25551:129-1610(+)|eukprot:CAMPEP_0196584156 /NCGR_PEP_ID=MMETSP1081-20130531/45955_1 /TAXON_ID=36882 /ORGANISM="Pyramimonas amylifera, Strain CCMP720" /LENGTH=493 /DNA_ID=CAMNT_0041905271 /DNA_START=120 /DNA_END=1601 /DNA_ORIENTATION=-
MAAYQKLRSVDFYRKIPRDLTEATLFGGSLSLLAALLMIALFVMELNNYLAVRTVSSIIVDRSVDGDLLRINFNFSFPSLSCEFASVDVSDAMGNHRVNLTKTVRRYPLDKNGNIVGNAVRDIPDPKYEDLLPTQHDPALQKAPGALTPTSDELTSANFAEALKKHPIVMINFYAPWCPWSQRLAPVWEAATALVHTKFPPEDGRIKLAKVDCTTEGMLCRNNHVQGFPSIRVFRSGADQLQHHGHHDHESYVGDRTTEALAAFATGLVPAAVASNAPPALPPAQAPNEPEEPAPQTIKVGAPGCSVEGFVLVKKVPGNLHISAHSRKHSFDYGIMNMTHVVHHLSFGKELSVGKWALIHKLHPEGLLNAWSNRLKGRMFPSHETNVTHEHYCQVVMTSVEPYSTSGRYNRVDLYEYTHHSHAIHTEDMPMAKLSFDPSPMQVLVKEEPRHFYHFVTTVCAIIGGVFTVAGIADSSVFHIVKLLKKVEIGKQF